jgi:DNA polymerase-1
MFNLIPPNEWIHTEQQLVEAANYCYNATLSGNPLGIDTETTGLRIDKDLPLIFSMSDGRRRFAFEFEQFGRHPWITQGLLANEQIRKVGTKTKFDMHILANAGVQVLGSVEDTIVQDALFDENRWGHGLKETAGDYLGLKMKEFKEVFPMRKGTAKVPGETAGDAIRRVLADPALRPQAEEYAGLDPYASVLVRNFLQQKLCSIYAREGWTLWNHYEQWELPFTRTLWNCERRGFMIGTGHLRAQITPMRQEMDRIEGEIAQLAGWTVNVNSPKQLQRLLFDQIRHKPIKMTDGGKSGIKLPSTDEEVLTILAEDGCPVSKKIMEFRKISKIYGTYIEGMLQWVDSGNRIHTTLNQGGTVTGRLSSSEPNLQNIPRPKTDIYKIRGAFVAEIGKRLVVLDYDQLEMKLMAHFSGDPRMIEAILQGRDLHCFTVHLMSGIPYEDLKAAKDASDAKKELTTEQLYYLDLRQGAKNTGFGLIYGIGKKKLAIQLSDELKREVTEDEAQSNINKYYGVFPGVKMFIKGTHAYCQQTEYVQTLMGRFRRLPGVNARGGQRDDDDGKGTAAEAKRQAVNTIIQGTAAEIAKAAMLRCDNDPELKSYSADLLLQIHDELIFEIPDDIDTARRVIHRAKQLMEDPFNGYQLAVPLTCGGGHGYSWVEAK